jgi:hypothetical protein
MSKLVRKQIKLINKLDADGFSMWHTFTENDEVLIGYLINTPPGLLSALSMVMAELVCQAQNKDPESEIILSGGVVGFESPDEFMEYCDNFQNSIMEMSQDDFNSDEQPTIQ